MRRARLAGALVVAVIAGLAWFLVRDGQRGTPLSGESPTESSGSRAGDLEEADATQIGSGEIASGPDSDRLPVHPDGDGGGGVDADSTTTHTFFLNGNLAIADELAALARPELVLMRSIGSDWKHDRTVSMDPGEWGPIEVAIGATRWFKLRLQGGEDMIPEERIVRVPLPGETVREEFAAQTGIHQWYMVEDPSGQPIEGAEVRVSWDAGDRWVQSVAHSQETGHALVRGIAPGTVVPSARKDGFAPKSFEPMEVPEDPPAVILLDLAKAGTIRGRCTYQGQPVRDFTVGFTGSGSMGGVQRRTFTDREDGAFEILDAPFGEVHLVASSQVSPGSESITVHVGEHPVEDVTLALQVGQLVSGTVLDAQTDQPVASALVQGFVRGRTGWDMRWGPWEPVDAFGRFELSSALKGENFLQVRAPGYATRDLVGQTTDDGSIKFGVVHLERGRTVRVLLTGGEGLDPSSYQVWAEGTDALPIRAFQDSGSVQYKNVSPGNYWFRLRHPDASTERLVADLSSTDDWEIVFEVGTASLSIEIAGREVSYRDKLFPFVEFSDPSGGIHTRTSTASSSKTLVRGLPAGSASVGILDEGGTVLALQEVSLVNGRVVTVPLTIDEPPLLVSVVDDGGVGVNGCLVMLQPVPEQGGADWIERTGADGVADLGPVPPGMYLVQLIHASRGRRFNVPFSLAPGESDAGFVLVADAAVAIQFLEGDEPIGATKFQLLDAHGAHLSPAPHEADSSGFKELDQLGPGLLRIRIVDHRMWPDEFELEVGSGTSPANLFVRRLGDLEIRVTNAVGVPVSGVTVDVWSSQGGDLSAWVDAGLVESSSPTRETDKFGVITVRGLPNGLYTVQASSEAGVIAEGTVDVPALDEATVILSVP